MGDDLQPIADRSVDGLAGVHQLDGELHRLALHAAADAFLLGGETGEGVEAVLGLRAGHRGSSPVEKSAALVGRRGARRS
jgi:hypothetical protein